MTFSAEAREEGAAPRGNPGKKGGTFCYRTEKKKRKKKIAPPAGRRKRKPSKYAKEKFDEGGQRKKENETDS